MLRLIAVMALLSLATPLFAVLVAVSTRADPSRPDGAPSVALPTPTAVASTAAAAEVHAALHAIGRRCRVARHPTRAIAAEVGTILQFAARYPNVSFSIDDEKGTTLALLFVVRDAVGRCAPSLVAKVQAAMPPQYRE